MKPATPKNPTGARSVVVFPIISSMIGGARSVAYTSRHAWITRADNSTVRVSRSALPDDASTWCAFKLADIADKAAQS